MADITGMLQAAAGAGGAEETDPNFNQTVLLLHGDGTNGAQNNTFVDSSTNNFTVTRNGNTTQGTFSPFSAPDGRWSNYFSGTSVGLENRVSGTVTAIGTGNFTISFWVYVTGSTTKAQIFCDGSNSVLLQINTSNQLEFYNRVTTAFVITGSASTALPTQEWAHIALIRSGTGTNQTKLYINGSEVGSATVSTNFTGTSMSIGSRFDTTGTEWFPTLGYISNFIYADSALSSAVPTAPNTNVSGTRLLTCQSNRFVDNSSSPVTLTVTSNVRVTPFSPFAPTAAYSASVNGGSGYFDGTGDYLSVGAASDWTFMSNASALFSIEVWIYFVATGSDQTICCTNDQLSANVGFALQIAATTNVVQCEITRGVSGSRVLTGATTGSLVPNAWNHILFTYDQSLASNNCNIYLNGASAETLSKTANAPSASDPATPLYIGSTNGSGSFVLGYIGSMRVSNVVRSSGIPTAPYTSDANTKLLANYTNAGIFDNTGKNVLETVGNAQIDTTTKKYGTGSMEFDGTGDYLVLPSSDFFNLGTADFTIEAWIYPQEASRTQMIFAVGDTDGTTGHGRFYVHSSNTLRYFNGTEITTSLVTVTLNTWHHAALVQESGSQTLYLDGVSVGTSTSGVAFGGNTLDVEIGSSPATTTQRFNGLIDDFRITKGVARYTTTFTPPTKASPDL